MMQQAGNVEKAILSLLESQAKLVEIMEAYKKGASLNKVEKMHNEWKTFYQVSELEAKNTLDEFRNLYAKAPKEKNLTKHSRSFSELINIFKKKKVTVFYESSYKRAPPAPPPRPMRSGRKTSLSSLDFSQSEDPCENFDRPPAPRPIPRSFQSSPLLKPEISCDMNQYKIPSSFLKRSNCIFKDYDFPKATLQYQNIKVQPACYCYMAERLNDSSSVKSCFVCKKLSSLKQVGHLPSVPSFDVVDRNKRNNDSRTRSVQRHQYINVCLQPPKDIIIDRDSIPEEMAPPPPVINDEAPEEHYKMVGAPTPVPAMFQVS